MNEFLSVLTGLINAIAAAVGAWVAFAQWRASRAKRQVAAPPPRAPAGSPRLPAPPPAPAVEQPPGRKLARAAAVAVGAGAATSVFAALADFAFWLRERSSGDSDEGLLTFFGVMTYLAALTALLLGLFVLVAGLVKRRRRIAKLGLLAVALSQTLWLAMWLTAVM
ncbi:hypothetical protein [Amycolatopsis sp. NPDC098790]|uniref:hypothetical protein n=1 Tax=Amycolatopsis sp. NPDC098790 TaxID=3363939 RepID=UPI003806FC83